MSRPPIRVLVAIKRVLDYAVKPRVAADRKSIDLSHAKMSMNPFCEIAVECALKLKEAGNAHEIIAVSIGSKSSQDTLRTALAMGVDRALLVEVANDRRSDVEHVEIAAVLAHVAKSEGCELVVAGKQSIDDDSGLVGPMLAAKLGWPQAHCASKLELDLASSSLRVAREVDGGLQHVRLTLPAVVTTDLRLNTPRYASIPNIMKAKKKPLTIVSWQDLCAKMGVSATRERTRLLGVEEPKARAGGVKVESVDELFHKLKNESKSL